MEQPTEAHIYIVEERHGALEDTKEWCKGAAKYVQEGCTEAFHETQDACKGAVKYAADGCKSAEEAVENAYHKAADAKK
jgi:hypothetical protein